MSAPPYGIIADLLKKGHVVPFLGAGVNYGMRQASAKWDERTSEFLPSGAELSRFLAEQSSFPSKNRYDLADLAKVASYFVETSDRGYLCERLHELFNRDYSPCEIHTYLAKRQTPLLIVTTNYDDMMERALQAAGHPYDLVIHLSDRKDVAASVLWWRQGSDKPLPVNPNELDHHIDLKTTSVVYKMHGTVDRLLQEWDSYVITEEDYVDFLSLMTRQVAVPSMFMRHFRERHFLFLGYGLHDWNLRVVLRNLKPILPSDDDTSVTSTEQDHGRTSWAVQYRPSKLEVALWNARKVKIYDVDISEFVKRLRESG
jgi:hypothetical protein